MWVIARFAREHRVFLKNRCGVNVEDVNHVV